MEGGTLSNDREGLEAQNVYAHNGLFSNGVRDISDDGPWSTPKVLVNPWSVDILQVCRSDIDRTDRSDIT